MSSIIGIVLTFICVFGGYMWAGGKLDIILHSLPYEMMIIGGAAVGAFACGNDMHTIKMTGRDIMRSKPILKTQTKANCFKDIQRYLKKGNL